MYRRKRQKREEQQRQQQQQRSQNGYIDGRQSHQRSHLSSGFNRNNFYSHNVDSNSRHHWADHGKQFPFSDPNQNSPLGFRKSQNVPETANFRDAPDFPAHFGSTPNFPNSGGTVWSGQEFPNMARNRNMQRFENGHAGNQNWQTNFPY